MVAAQRKKEGALAIEAAGEMQALGNEQTRKSRATGMRIISEKADSLQNHEEQMML